MINDTKISLLFGLPGAGKTTALGKVMEDDAGLKRLSGGSLIAAGVPESERDQLRKLGSDEILINQEKLVLNFQRELSKITKGRVVFDGHCIVKDGEKITEIPLSVIERLAPDQIIFFDVEPEVIVERRKGDFARPDRESESVADLERFRGLQKKICRSYATALSIPFDVAENEAELQALLR